MTKEEKIKEAWGLAYDEVKHLLTDNGYIWSVDLAHIRLNLSKYNLDLNYNDIGVRPKSLKGIENNNGWNSMEQPDFEENEYVLFLRFINGEGEPPIFTCVLCDDFEIGYFTHWKRVDYGKPPIY